MQAAQIFEQIGESRLLKALSTKNKLVFIGEKETIIYLKNFFDKQQTDSNNEYCFWQENQGDVFDSIDVSLNYNALVIASIDNEHFIFEKIQKNIQKLKIQIPILKLFSDIFINLQSGCPLLQKSDCQLIPPKVAYAIISTPRSGSTFLCETLTSTKIAGFPDEHLRTSSEILSQYCQFDCGRYLRILMTHETTNNGVFGTKLISHFLAGHLKSSFEITPLIQEFKYIYLVRKDRIAQAVSLFLASKTKVWHLYSGKQSKEYQDKLKQVSIEDEDLEKVDRIYQNLLEQEQYLEEFFKENQISPLTIEYEKFVLFPEEYLNKIIKYLKISDLEQPIEVINKYQFWLYSTLKKLKIDRREEKRIKIRLTTQKLQSSISQEIKHKYQAKYDRA